MSSLLERIALEVKEKRQGLGMSQEELAAKIDKTTSFIVNANIYLSHFPGK